MDWLNELWVQIPAGILLVASAIAVAYKTLPTIWAVMKAAVRLGEIHATVDESLPILKELNANFQPNDGTSIHDRIVGIERSVEDLGDGIAEVKNLVTEHLVQRQTGGHRNTDP